jgi:modified peptide precursor CbpA
MEKATPMEQRGSFGVFFVEPYKDKGEAMEEQKDKKQDQPVIISYRRRCESDTAGTGLSHYIMIEDEE